MVFRKRLVVPASETRLTREELTGLVHDLRHKLSGVMGSSDILLNTELSTGSVHGSLEKMSNWVGEVDYFSNSYEKRKDYFRDRYSELTKTIADLSKKERIEKDSQIKETFNKEKRKLELQRREVSDRWRGAAAEYLFKVREYIQKIKPHAIHITEKGEALERNSEGTNSDQNARELYGIFNSSWNALNKLVENKRGALTDVDAVKLAREYSILFSHRKNKPKVSFKFSKFPFSTVRAHPFEIRRVIERILNNAVEADASEIQVSARPTLFGKKVVIKIRNNGKPIPLKIAEKIYGGHTTKPHGTGLGIPGAKRMIEAHGGTLSHVSHKSFFGFKPKYSTTFKIVIPHNRREEK